MPLGHVPKWRIQEKAQLFLEGRGHGRKGGMINLGIVRSSQELSNVMSVGARSVLELSLGPPIMPGSVLTTFKPLNTCLIHL